MCKDSYLKVRDEAEKDWSERPEHYTSNGVSKKRRYSFKQEKVALVLAEKAEKGLAFINPYNRYGVYYGIVEALGQLGINEWHTYKQLELKMQEVMTGIICKGGINSWDKFVGRMPKSPNSKTYEGKIMQNVTTIQRFDENAYGWKLAQFGECVDVKVENDNYYYRLNCTYFGSLDWSNPDVAIMQVEPMKPRVRKSSKGSNTETVNTEIPVTETGKEVISVGIVNPGIRVEMTDIQTI